MALKNKGCSKNQILATVIATILFSASASADRLQCGALLENNHWLNIGEEIRPSKDLIDYENNRSYLSAM